uniref:Uncharacterized protein n=1 Tax=Romanomermis culicivorax TaxID=13658 RepID=A0A915JUN3_ROMCU
MQSTSFQFKDFFGGRGMNGFKHSMETVCGWLGALRESMMMTFLATPDAWVIKKGPIKLG